MNKRVTLTSEDIELINTALKMLRDKSDSLPVTYPEHGLAARQRFDQLEKKLKTEPSISKVSASSVKSSVAQKESK